MTTYAARLLTVLPGYGKRTLRLAAYHANLGDGDALKAAKELLAVRLVEIAAPVHLASVIELTDLGRGAQLASAA